MTNNFKKAIYSKVNSNGDRVEHVTVHTYMYSCMKKEASQSTDTVHNPLVSPFPHTAALPQQYICQM